MEKRLVVSIIHNIKGVTLRAARVSMHKYNGNIGTNGVFYGIPYNFVHHIPGKSKALLNILKNSGFTMLHFKPIIHQNNKI